MKIDIDWAKVGRLVLINQRNLLDMIHTDWAKVAIG